MKPHSNQDPLKKKRDFSDFMRNASGRERERVFMKAIDESIADQRKIIERSEQLRWRRAPKWDFVHLNLTAHRRGLLAKPGHACARNAQVAVDGNAAPTGQIGDLNGVQIQHKQAHNLAEFALRNMRAENVAILHEISVGYAYSASLNLS